jgi:hypothetical protein
VYLCVCPQLMALAARSRLISHRALRACCDAVLTMATQIIVTWPMWRQGVAEPGSQRLRTTRCHTFRVCIHQRRRCGRRTAGRLGRYPRREQQNSRQDIIGIDGYHSYPRWLRATSVARRSGGLRSNAPRSGQGSIFPAHPKLVITGIRMFEL